MRNDHRTTETRLARLEAAQADLRAQLHIIAERLDRVARGTENVALTDARHQAQMTHELGRDRCPVCGCPEYAAGDHSLCGDHSYRCDHCGCRGSLFLSP
jgi:hypothetical protein